MPWHITGSCNHCGKCCRNEQNDPEGRLPCTSPILGENQTECPFYTDDGDNTHKYGHCLVFRANQYKNAKDKDDNKITDEQLAWFLYNCEYWPMREKDIEQLVQGKWALPSTCGYSLEEI